MQDKLNLKELDQKLARLKEIGLREISKSTKLASSKIEDVLEKRFDKLDRVRARGFINILEREYEMDLSDWLKAQHEHTRKESITNVSQMLARQDEQNDQQSSNAQKSQEKAYEERVLDIALKAKPIGHSQKESRILLYVISGSILFLIIGYFAYKAFIDDRLKVQNLQLGTKQEVSSQTQELTDSRDTSSTYEGIFFDPSQSPTNGAGVSNGENLEDIEQKSQASREIQTSNIQTQDLLQPAREFPESTLQNGTNFDSDLSQTSMKGAAVSVQVTPESKAIKDDILHINSTRELWVGVIYLDTGKKEQFLHKDRYEIKVNERMLFVMGHGDFTLTLNGENINHSVKPPVRMYYDGSVFADIAFTRFKQLNGGAEW